MFIVQFRRGTGRINNFMVCGGIAPAGREGL